MDLSDIIVPEGCVPKPIVTCVIEGILEESDLRELTLSTSVGADPVEDEDPSDLKKIREKHHSVARMIAGGLTQRMVAQLCGYTESYLSVLLNNPSMQELVELYRIQHGAAQNVVVEKLRTVGLKAVEKLDEKIDAGTLNNQELLAAAKLGLDRGGHGPTSHQHIVSENHVIDHAELKKRNEAARERNARQIVSSEEVRKALPAPQNEEADISHDNSREMGSEGSGLDEDRLQ